MVVAAGIATVLFGRDLYLNRKEKQYGTPPGFIKTAYRSFKDKVCFLVEFKE